MKGSLGGHTAPSSCAPTLTCYLRYPNGVSSTPVRYRYVYGTRVNAPDYVIQDGVIKYRLVHDHLGSVRFAYDATVTGTQGRHLSRRYDVLGAVVAEDVTGVDLPFGFAGGLYDREAGFVDNAGAPVLVHGRNVALVRFGARDYDPFAGRWTAPDPIHFEGGDSNLYGYCGGDPVNFVDVNGEHPLAWLIALLFAANEVRHDGSFGGGYRNSFGAPHNSSIPVSGDSVEVCTGRSDEAILQVFGERHTWVRTQRMAYGFTQAPAYDTADPDDTRGVLQSEGRSRDGVCYVANGVNASCVESRLSSDARSVSTANGRIPGFPQWQLWRHCGVYAHDVISGCSGQ